MSWYGDTKKKIHFLYHLVQVIFPHKGRVPIQQVCQNHLEGELARNADSRQDLSLCPRDSGKGMKWGLDIYFPGEDCINHCRAIRKVLGVKIPP